MLLQRGRFLINSIDELESLEEDKDGLRRVIDLNYMGKFEYEGNAIPASRMTIEYNKDLYEFRYFDMFDASGNQMIAYCRQDHDLVYLPNKLYETDYSFYQHIKYPDKEFDTNFWWNISSDYMIFFGENKKEIINYFINGCYQRDGGKQLIKEKLFKCGYIIE